MSEPIRQRVEMRDFPGLDRDADPRDVEAGAARELVNLIPRPGSMGVRRGLTLVSFEETTDVSS